MQQGIGAFRIDERLTDKQGRNWLVICVHPPVGRRDFAYTILDVEDEYAYLVYDADVREMGLRQAD